jgi:hypothetical protein
MLHEGLSVKQGSLKQRLVHLERALKIAIPPASPSDRSCYRNVGKWLGEKCQSAGFVADEVLPRVLDFALEASGPESRNPAAVFMSILKKELNYPK